MNSALRLLLLSLMLTRGLADAVQDQFQKALFEEEANQNLTNAISAYQDVIETAEAQRRYGATALFRLGECYRKLGRTNDAIAAYQRVINEHPSQSNIVTLSRQNLAVLGGETVAVKSSPQAPASSPLPGVDSDLAEAARIEGILKAVQGYKDKDDPQWLDAILAALPNPRLNQINEQRLSLIAKSRVERDALPSEKNKDAQHLFELNQLLSEEAERYLTSKRLEAEMLRVGAQARQKALGLQSPAKAEPEDPETAEIQRLEKLEKESPDLLRAFDQAGYNSLHTAAEKGQNRVVEHLLSRGLDINQPAPNSRETALFRAVRAGRLATVDLLLKRGADINARNRSTETATYLAISLKYPLIIDRLLQGNPDLNSSAAGTLIDGRATPLSLAVTQGNIDLIKRLLSAGANITQPSGAPPVTYLAIINGNAAALGALLDAGADAHERYAGNRSPGMTLLHYAVISEGLDKTLPLLIAKGAEKELKDSGEWSPLFLAIKDTQIKGAMTREQRVSLLLNAGSDPNAMSLYSTPLIEALTRAEKCVKPLLDAKADPNFRPPLGTFPIIYALGSEVSTEALGMLLEAGANPNVRGTPQDGYAGLSALDLAVDRRNKTKLELLLKHGADPNRRNALGETPLEHLKKYTGFRNAAFPGSPPPVAAVSQPGEIVSGQAASRESSIAELAEVLRKAGAREDLPDFNSIKVGRRSTASTVLLINRDRDGLNRITLLEAIAMAVRKIDGLDTMRDIRSQAMALGLLSKRGARIYNYPEQLAWPDWQKITISRPSSDGRSWTTIPVNPDILLNAESCDAVPLLQWGDVVDIPEAVHALLPSPGDPSPPLWPAFTNCIYGGRITFITPGFTNTLGNGYDPQRSSIRPSGLMDWIGSTVLRSSSDVSRVTVRRAAFRGEPAWVRTFDLTFDSPEQVDLFLRDGDVVEVPDLIPATSGTTPAKARVFGALHGTLILPEGQVTRLSEIATRFGRNDAADLKNVKLYRTDPKSGYVDTIEADVEKILRANDPAADLELRNGDRIEVPKK